MKAHDFDRTFDAGNDVDALVDWSKARRPNIQTHRVNIDFPAWVVESLNREARRLGVTRQSLIETWIAERLGMEFDVATYQHRHRTKTVDAKDREAI